MLGNVRGEWGGENIGMNTVYMYLLRVQILKNVISVEFELYVKNR